MISIEDFKKIEMRVGKILTAEPIAGSEKLLKLQVDVGIEMGERQIIAGIGKYYTPESLVGRQVVIVANLEPRSIMGLESQGMLLAASDVETIAIVSPDTDNEIKPGALIR